MRTIASELNRSPSTISRELRRNQDRDKGQYRPFVAQRLAAERRARPGRGKLVAAVEMYEAGQHDVATIARVLGVGRLAA